MKARIVFPLLLLCSPVAFAQPSNPSIILVTSTPAGSCSNGLPLQYLLSTGHVYSCQAGTWADITGAGGAVAWSTLTNPTGNLSLTMGSNTTTFAQTIPFTAQAAFAGAWQYSINSLNFGTEWNTIYSAFMPNAYPSDAFDVGITVPNTSAVFQSNAIGAFVDCSQPSGTHYCVALYGQGIRNANGAQVSVINGNGSDNNFTGFMIPGEFNSQVQNAGTTGATLVVTANITNAGTNYDGLDLGGYGSVGSYKYAMNVADNSATTAINIGKLTATSGSMPIQFSNGADTATLALNSTNQVQSSNPVVAPSYATTTNCASAASPAVCGTASAGLVAVAAAGTTLVVDTSAVGAASEVLLTFDSSVGTALSVTCNTAVNQPTVSARSPGVSFTITMGSSLSVNPDCISYQIINALLGSMRDTFTGANNTALASHTADTGQTWAQMNQANWTGSLHLNGTNSITGILSAYFSSLAPSSADYTVSEGMTLGASGAGWDVVFARLNGESGAGFSGYGCRFVQGTGILLEKWTAGVNAQIGTTDTTFTSGTHTVAIKTSGTTITCVRDGTNSAQATGTDATYSAAGQVGLAINQGSGSGYYFINSPFTVQ